MAITAYGVSPSMGEAEWAEFHDIHGRGQWHEVVSAATQMAVTAAAGTRNVTVSAGSMAVCGVLVKSTANVTLNHTANATGNTRIDAVVLRIDWTGDVDTAATLVVKPGTASATPVAPSLTRAPGVTWEVLLANVTIGPSLTTITSANIVQRTPQQRIPVASRVQPDAATVVGTGTPVVATISGGDPGWPYLLDIRAVMAFSVVTAGRGELTISVNSTDVGAGRAGLNNEADAVIRPAIVGPYTGAWVARLSIARGTGMTQDLVTIPGLSNFSVTRIPS